MHQQFCMVAFITNFLDKNLYQALCFLSLAKPMEKFNQFSLAPFLTEFVQENIFTLQWAGGRKHLGMRDGEELNEHGKRRPTGGNYMWPLLGFTPIFTDMASGVSCFVQLWSQDIGNAFLGKHYFIPWAFIQSQCHSPGGLNLPYQQKVWTSLPDSFFSCNTSLYTQPSCILTFRLAQLNWNSWFAFDDFSCLPVSADVIHAFPAI